jgi:hypothetical protein
MKECAFCGEQIVGPYWQEITGWVLSPKRDQLTLRVDVEPPRYACGLCIRKRQLGVAEDQGVLL